VQPAPPLQQAIEIFRKGNTHLRFSVASRMSGASLSLTDDRLLSHACINSSLVMVQMQGSSSGNTMHLKHFPGTYQW
jgi:hypothetical protein